MRRPSLINDSLVSRLAFPTGEGVAVSTLRGDDDLDAEELGAYEAGFRTRFGESVALDVSAFFNDYDDHHLESLRKVARQSQGWLQEQKANSELTGRNAA